MTISRLSTVIDEGLRIMDRCRDALCSPSGCGSAVMVHKPLRWHCMHGATEPRNAALVLKSKALDMQFYSVSSHWINTVFGQSRKLLYCCCL
jgi:hypothetical protein